MISLAIATALPVAIPMALPGVAVAQTVVAANDIRIASVGVEQLRRLRPGNVLAFRLTGTPASTVTLQIAGATQTLQLNEFQPGEYAGDYTIRSRDRLTASSSVTARLQKNGRTTSAMLGRSLLQGASDPVVAGENAPVGSPMSAPITAFTVTAADGYQPGDELSFSLKGQPGGTARVAVQGVDRRIGLTEVARGVYEGGYVIRRSDKLHSELVVDGFLLSDRRETSQRFERRIDRGGNDMGRNDMGRNDGGRNDGGRNDIGRNDSGRNDGRDTRQQTVATCATCGAIESVNIVEVKGDSPNIIGTIAGGLLGGVAGNQVGGGSGKDLATIIGAVGGAYAGNRAENNMGKTKVHRVTVRLDNGTTQSFDYASDPTVQLGTRVKIENGALIRL